ncbi:hypothetical protein [Phycisphaera mikurensis]|uniref:hypothetical protein n=1 Tax=Phycisphaera mikurensis TaxID=547188 RepID=UPI00161A2BD5|nr:hypothetical protein [Phycisphaera mikurensis]MBB6442085.1 hypothetical protein [Phycisphaera mikurensis]
MSAGHAADLRLRWRRLRRPPPRKRRGTKVIDRDADGGLTVFTPKEFVRLLIVRPARR